MSTHSIKINIDGKSIECQSDESVLEAALNAGIYIPTLCYHPDLPSYSACGLCAVEIEGSDEPILACETSVKPGMKVTTSSPNLKKIRQEKLAHILTNHPHACLVCAEKEGCAREPCSLNVPLSERCCEKLGDCELERIADYIGIPTDTLRYKPRNLPTYHDNPFIKRDYNLCIGCGRCIRACDHIRGLKILGELPDTPELIDPTIFPEKLMDSGCQFCGLCVDVCPTGALLDCKEKILDQTPCQAYCPAHIDIARFLRQIADGNFTGALTTMYQAVPFPGTLGYVCYFPCESECRRSQLDDAVSIRVLKRLTFEQINDIKIGKGENSSDKKIAVVGSGPAGLSCAFYLEQWGHNVTVFEAKEKPGGMLRYGIPTFRLPRSVLEKEIDIIKQTGIEIKVNTKVTSIDDLHQQGFDAVFVGIGAQKGLTMGIDGETEPRVLDALQFLSEVYGEVTSTYDKIKDKNKIGRRVAIIGGGDTAIDVARTVLRLGSTATLFYRRSKAEMPAFPKEIEEAEKEGVKFQFLSAPVAISSDKHGVIVEFIKMELGAKDDSGRPKPMPIENSKFSHEFDHVVTAIGQVVDPIDGINHGSQGWPEYDIHTLNTGSDVYVGGDVVGPSSVVKSIAMGRQAAVQIHKYLGGNGEDTLPSRDKPVARVSDQGKFLKERITIPTLDLTKSILGFSNIELSPDKDQGICEANRCLQCDLRLYLKSVVEPPVDMNPFVEERISVVPEKPGVYTLYDGEKNIVEIKGVDNLKRMLKEKLRLSNNIKFFTFEEDPMYSKRESEMLQQYIKQHGEMPSGEDELDDLF